MKDPNGAVIYQRSSGTNFDASTVFTNFCPAGGCPATLLLTVTLTDSYGDGWNNNILGFRQGSAVVGNFGNTFTSGSSVGPLFISVVGNLSTSIVVTQLGSKTNELGFTVKAPNGTTIYQRSSGTTFDINTVFSNFCPIGGCPNTLVLNITMTDSFGDGWNSNILAVRQNNIIVGTFGNNFSTGFSSGPVFITVQGSQ